MKIKEIIKGVYAYAASIRLKQVHSSASAKSIVFADGISQARALLAAMYGADSVISVTKISERDLKESVPNGTVPKPIPRILPTGYAYKLVQKALLNQMKRNALHVNPTIDDLRATQDDFETEQKRINSSYEKALKDREKWAAIRKRRKENLYKLHTGLPKF